MAGENNSAAPAGGTTPAGGTPNASPPGGAPPQGGTALGGDAPPQGGTALGTGDGGGNPSTPKPVEIKLPEGVTLPEDVINEYKTLAEKFDPQKGLEFVLKNREAAVADIQKQVSDAVNKQREEWLTAARKDPEIGGEKWDASVADARKAVSALGGDALREVLNKTGLGNHPGIIRAFARVGRALSEDSIAGKGGNGTAPPDLSKLTPEERLAKTLYTEKKEN